MRLRSDAAAPVPREIGAERTPRAGPAFSCRLRRGGGAAAARGVGSLMLNGLVDGGQRSLLAPVLVDPGAAVVAVDAGGGQVPRPAQRGARPQEVGAVEREDGIAVHVGDWGDGSQDVGGFAEPLEGLAAQRGVEVFVGAEGKGVDQAAVAERIIRDQSCTNDLDQKLS